MGRKAGKSIRMKKIIYAMKDLSKNFFNWRGRLSREGYGWTWAGILIVDLGLAFFREAALLFVHFYGILNSETMKYTMTSGNRPSWIISSGILISEIMKNTMTVWNVVMFFPILFATMRRYHDSGKAGWKVILFNGLSLVFCVLGFLIFSFIVIAFAFGGGYMITADADVKMSRLLGPAALSAFLFLAGIGFAVLNIKYILKKSDPMENVYGKPMPSPFVSPAGNPV